MPLARAQTLTHYGAFLTRGGQTIQAQALLTDALRLAEACGADWHAHCARVEWRRHWRTHPLPYSRPAQPPEYHRRPTHPSWPDQPGDRPTTPPVSQDSGNTPTSHLPQTRYPQPLATRGRTQHQHRPTTFILRCESKLIYLHPISHIDRPTPGRFPASSSPNAIPSENIMTKPHVVMRKEMEC